MWKYKEINFADLYNHIIENTNTAYSVSLLENNKYQWNIHIYNRNVFKQLPFQFEIIIMDENKIKQGRCDFDITLTGRCEIINIDSDRAGLGSIMFFIIENIIRQTETNLKISISEIYGELANKHKINGDWLKSIPFYCMKANEYSYSIIFNFGDDKIVYENESDKDENYKKSLALAEYFIDTYDRGRFSIYRYDILIY